MHHFLIVLIKIKLSFKYKTIWLIAIASLVRCIIACNIDLGNDEVYYRMYAQYLHWNYFDHPPMVALLIRATTANLHIDNEFFIRLGSVCCAAATTWLFYLSGNKISNAYAGFLAALIYTATIYGSIIAGTFILPDSPQILCWTTGIYALLYVTENNRITLQKQYAVIFFGIICGIGMLCKIHTVFLWIGFSLYVLLPAV